MAQGKPEAFFGTVLTAMVTPFTADGAVDLDAVERVAAHLVATGHDGIVVNGTTGEAPTVTEPEKVDIVRVVKQTVAGRAKVVAGAGSNDTRHSIQMATEAEAAGADALLVVTPYYSRPTQAGIAAHFAAVADSTDLPVMLYDIPGRCCAAIGDEALEKAAAHPRILAVKDATGNVPQGAARLERTGLAWYSGDDGLNLPFLVAGASGVVSVAGHVTGRDLAALVAAVRAQDLAAARRAAASAAPAIEAVCGAGQGAAMAKAALQAIGVLDSRGTRLPILPADDETFVALCHALFDYGYKEALI